MNENIKVEKKALDTQDGVQRLSPNIKVEEITSEKDFNPLVLSLNTSFAQAYFYGEIQKSMGRNVRRFVFKTDTPQSPPGDCGGAKKADVSLLGDCDGVDIETLPLTPSAGVGIKEIHHPPPPREGGFDGAGSPLAFCQLVKYSLPLGKSYLYAAYGPTVKLPFSENFLKVFKDKILNVLSEEKAVFARLDFMPPVNQKDDLGLLDKFFKKAPHHAGASASFQPRVEWVIDLTKSEDEILKNMRQKARYNIKLARQKGVEIEIAKDNFEKYFESFYFLLGETAKRGEFFLHPKSYYEKMLGVCEKNKSAFFVIARYNNVDLIINFVIHCGNMATYVFGGSSEEYRNLMPAYLVQWESILESKRVGCKLYSFGNVNTEKYANTEWEGFSVFKKKFGGTTYEHSDFYDLVANTFWYRIYNLGKRIG